MVIKSVSLTAPAALVVVVFSQVICPYPAEGGSMHRPPPLRMLIRTGWLMFSLVTCKGTAQPSRVEFGT
jgi:hypothetical protein